MQKESEALAKSLLGKRGQGGLVAVPRYERRLLLGIDHKLPFQGVDQWTAYEFSWLQPNGVPVVRILEIDVPCESPYLIESKSMKLYLGSYASKKASSEEDLIALVASDMTVCAGSRVSVRAYSFETWMRPLGEFEGMCLDGIDTICDAPFPHKNILIKRSETGFETLSTHLLRSNCLVTGQPDWGSLQIQYAGVLVDHASLLRYIVSFREHQEFHEHCIERIFADLLAVLQPQELIVTGRYTRRGGIDINPFRSLTQLEPPYVRLIRQ